MSSTTIRAATIRAAAIRTAAIRALGLALSLVLASAGGVSAQTREGLAIEALRGTLAERGLEAREIELDDAPDARAVRIELARAGAPGAIALLDVHVRASEAEAHGWAESRVEIESTRGLVARGAGTWADVATGAAGLVVAREANVVAVVRTIDATLDALAITDAVREAILRSPAGAPRAWRAPEVEVPRELGPGASFVVPIPRELVAARVMAEGAGYARRTPRGWVVTRTAQGALVVRVVGVDALLRRSAR